MASSAVINGGYFYGKLLYRLFVVNTMKFHQE